MDSPNPNISATIRSRSHPSHRSGRRRRRGNSTCSPFSRIKATRRCRIRSSRPLQAKDSPLSPYGTEISALRLRVCSLRRRRLERRAFASRSKRSSLFPFSCPDDSTLPVSARSFSPKFFLTFLMPPSAPRQVVSGVPRAAGTPVNAQQGHRGFPGLRFARH